MGVKVFLKIKFQAFVQLFFHNKNAHFIEIIIMKKFGYWPGNSLCIWKMCLITINICYTLLPGINYLINTIRRKDSKAFAFVVPEVLLEIQQTLSFFTFLIFFKDIRRFQEIFDFEWNRHDALDEWRLLRDKTTKFSNRISFCYHVNMHVAGLFYFLIPTLVFVVKYYFGFDKNIAKTTPLLAE